MTINRDSYKAKVQSLRPTAQIVHDEGFAGGDWIVTDDAQTSLGRGKSEEAAWKDAVKRLSATGARS